MIHNAKKYNYSALNEYCSAFLGKQIGQVDAPETWKEAIQLAIAISYLAQGVSSPNPPVGAVVLNSFGRICGLGVTSKYGGDHAEVAALAMAGEQARDGLLAVTLEPCNHWGKTPPCVDGIIRAGIALVIIAVPEPTPLAQGGASRLAESKCHVVMGLFQDTAEIGPLREWLFFVQHRRPYISAKIAMSLDGKITPRIGSQYWLTNAQSQAHAHHIRSRLDAIIIGTQTCLIDNPRLTARDDTGKEYPHQPIPVIIGNTQIPPNYHVHQKSSTVFLPRLSPDQLKEYLPGVMNILIEGGPRLLGIFFAQNYINRIYLYIAPLILGCGQSAFRVFPHNTFAEILSEIPGDRIDNTSVDDNTGEDRNFLSWQHENHFVLEENIRLGNDIVLTYHRQET